MRKNTMKSTAAVFRALACSVMLLGAAGFVATVATVDVSYAKGGNGNGNGGGNGGGKGGGNGGGNSADKADRGNSNANRGGNGLSRGNGLTRRASSEERRQRGQGNFLRDLFGVKPDRTERRAARTEVQRPRPVQASRPPVTRSATPVPRPERTKGNKLAQELGVHPSELGALNAANASPNALRNASPNSRVGKIAIYAGEVATTRQLAAELLDAQELLDTLPEPTRDTGAIDDEIALLDGEKSALADQIAALEAEQTATGDPDGSIADEIEALNGEIATIDDSLSALGDERADAAAYEEAVADVETLEDEVATQEIIQRESLEAAANKEVTDEVEIAVQKLLGIYEEPVETELVLEEAALEE